MARIVYLQGWYIVTYALGIYHLNLFIAFLTPKIDPADGGVTMRMGQSCQRGSTRSLGPSSAGYRSSSFGTPPPRRRWWALGAPSLRPSMCRCSGPSCCFISSPYSASP
uniref:Putative golgi involved in er retention rer n=1 Tax=Ixodes ricinus TaxID=34613 RepID=V5H9C6_IXORI